MWTIIGEYRYTDVYESMEQDYRKNAFSGVVIEPYHEDSKQDCREALPYDPRYTMVCLNIWNQVPYPPQRPHDHAGGKCVPTV
jgi:hypothetical protein